MTKVQWTTQSKVHHKRDGVYWTTHQGNSGVHQSGRRALVEQGGVNNQGIANDQSSLEWTAIETLLPGLTGQSRPPRDSDAHRRGRPLDDQGGDSDDADDDDGLRQFTTERVVSAEQHFVKPNPIRQTAVGRSAINQLYLLSCFINVNSSNCKFYLTRPKTRRCTLLRNAIFE